jgi:hypothetical protein
MAIAAMDTRKTKACNMSGGNQQGEVPSSHRADTSHEPTKVYLAVSKERDLVAEWYQWEPGNVASKAQEGGYTSLRLHTGIVLQSTAIVEPHR